MHISANMYSFIKSYGHPDLLDESLVMEKMYNIGYRHVDINFTELTNKNFILRDDGWRQRVEKVGETAARLGMRIHQSHLPFADQASPDFYAGGYAEYFDICMHRAYQASALLGVEWGVIHPRTYPEFNNEDKACLAANHAYYDQFVELGVGLGVGTAMENQLPYLKRQRACRYCQHYDQLIELVDSFREPLVGICWDTGHANQSERPSGGHVVGAMEAGHRHQSYRRVPDGPGRRKGDAEAGLWVDYQHSVHVRAYCKCSTAAVCLQRF